MHFMNRISTTILLAFVWLYPTRGNADDPAVVQSQLLKNGTLIYSDAFGSTLDREWWQPRTKT